MFDNFKVPALNLYNSIIFLFPGLFVYWFCLPRSWRGWFLNLLSLIVVFIFTGKLALYLLFNIALIYFGVALFFDKNRNRRSIFLMAALIWLIANLCLYKYPPALTWLSFSVRQDFLIFLGWSYVLFKLIHYVVEKYRANLPKISFLDFLLYTIFFPTFLAGPIERAEHFCPQITANKKIELAQINSSLFRIVWGIIKKFLLADNLFKLIQPALFQPAGHSSFVVLAAVYGLALRLYLDFSGYADLAIGLSGMFGYRIAENFNRPFLQPNIARFWRSWHITLYEWIRTYFFIPVFGYKASIYKVYLGLFFTMLVLMLWHQFNWNFLILGIYYGLGLVSWQLFQELKNAWPVLARVTDSLVGHILGVFLTVSFFSLGMPFFQLSLPDALAVVKKIFLGGLF